MIYTTTSTTKNIRSLVGKCFLLVISMLLCGVSAWAAEANLNEKYKSEETNIIRSDAKTGGITISGASTVVVISGNLRVNGKLVVKDGAVLIVEGSFFQNANVEIDGARVVVMKNWNSYLEIYRITVTEKENSLFVCYGDYDSGALGIFVDPKKLIVYEQTWGSAQTAKDYVYVPNAISYYSEEGKASKAAENVIQEYATLLPITLNYFTAEQDGEDVVFDWQTASEVNNDFFTIEYSLDGIHFSELANEDGNGTTSEINDYTVSVSADGFAGITYFRLKQTDFNGEYSYSDVIPLNVENETSLYVYPNPAVDVITIAGSFERIFVCDAYSRTLSVQQESTNSFNVSALPVGTYYVVATTKQGKKVLPFVKR